MSDPTPVPLNEIERMLLRYGSKESREQFGALCEALRIAVEALDEMAGGCRCGLCSDSVATSALARIRGLVDLGEKP